jgi:CheY-like chemotaxis protein
MDDIVEILLFEDNPGDIGLIEEMLEEINDFSYNLKNVKTLNEGLTLLKNRTFDVILWNRLMVPLLLSLLMALLQIGIKEQSRFMATWLKSFLEKI